MTDTVYPPPLAPGAVVRVIAPAGPFDPSLGWRGLGWLSERYRLRFDRGIFARHGYLAGDDRRRLGELQAALAEPGVGAVLCARGGYGVSRIAHLVDWSLIARTPRWIIGFSDNTALHVEICKLGIASLHACHLTALGRSDARTRSSLAVVLEHPTAPRRFDRLSTLRSGAATGPLFVGNLSLLHACAAAGRLRLPDACVLVLEDVGELPYRIDRMLTTLLVGGHLDRVSGVVLGEFERCTSPDAGPTVEQVALERLEALGVVLAAGAPVGHGSNNEPMVVGARASLVADSSGAQLDLAAP